MMKKTSEMRVRKRPNILKVKVPSRAGDASKEASPSIPNEGPTSVDAIGQRLRDQRHALGLSLDTAAERTRVSKAMLSAIERGEKVPTIRVLVNIVEGYGTNISQLLVAQPDEESAITVIRRTSRSRLVDPRTGVLRELLSQTFVSRGLEILWFEIPKGGRNASLPPRHSGVRQHLTIAAGELRLVAGRFSVDLAEGDSADFDANVSHGFINVGEKTCKFFLVLDTAP